MTTSGPIYSHLLKLAAITFLATSAFCQASPKYDPATEGRFKGVIEEITLVPPSGGQPIAYLMLKHGTDAVHVFLCPKKFLDDMGIVSICESPARKCRKAKSEDRVRFTRLEV